MSSKGPKVLLARTHLGNKTKRYQAVFSKDNLEFLYFREISTTERKNLARGIQPERPFSNLEWESCKTFDDKYYWQVFLPDGRLLETTELDYPECPEDCETYILEGEIISRRELEECLEAGNLV